MGGRSYAPYRLCGNSIPGRNISTSLRQTGSGADLEVTLDVHQERNIADAGDDKHEQRDGEDGHGECRRHRESGGNVVAIEVLADIVPFTVILLREVEGVEGQSVDGLARSVSEEKPFPAYGDRQNMY